MNLLKKRREHALLVFCFCESIFLRCSYPSIFSSFFSLSLLRSFVRSFFYTLICFIFFLSFLFFLAKETVVFLFLTFCPFFPVIMNMKSRQYRVNTIMTIFAVSGRSIQLFSSFLPKNQLRGWKDHNTWRRMLRDFQRYFFFLFVRSQTLYSHFRDRRKRVWKEKSRASLVHGAPNFRGGGGGGVGKRKMSVNRLRMFPYKW